MAQIKSATIHFAGTGKNLLDQCFLNGNYIPDFFAIQAENRSHIEYACETSATRQTVCMAIFDGIRGSCGDEASARMAAEMMKDETSRLAMLPLPLLENFMQRYVMRVNAGIMQTAQKNPAAGKIGTTIVCLFLRGDQAVVFRVGKCQAFLSSHHEIKPLAWKAAACSTSASRPADYLGQTAGDSPVAFETTGIFQLDDRDTLLLATRSLSETVGESAIKACLGKKSPKEMVDCMMKSIIEQGCPESITATVVSWSAENKPSSSRFSAADTCQVPAPRVERPKDYQVPAIPDPEKPKIVIEKMTFRHIWDSLPSWIWIIGLLALLIIIVLIGLQFAGK